VYSYTATVAHDASQATFDVDPATPSGLVYLGDTLIDDTQPRTVNLADGDVPTVITLRATAQDHTTSTTYTISIVRAEPEPSLPVTASAAGRCIAGKAVVTIQATNGADVPVTLSISTPYGAKNVASVAPGKTTSAAFTTRLVQLGADSGLVTATAAVAGEQVTAALPLTIPPVHCG
jgi:hypothetical protein